MAEQFQVLDLSGYWNSGRQNVQTSDGPLWPAPEADPERTGLQNLPTGSCRFWGIPLCLGEGEPDQPSLVVVAQAGGEEVPVSVAIEVQAVAKRVLFAHVCGPAEATWPSVEGIGEPMGTYRVVFEGGSTEEVGLRRRFEVHDLAIPWGHHPFLCRHCREFRSVPLNDRSNSYGYVQTGVTAESSDLAGWWLYAWENPHPDLKIERIEVVAAGPTPLALGAITLCLEEGDPFHWPGREEIAISVDGDPDAPLEVEMERGVVARQDRLFVPGEDFLSTDEAGWGRGGQEVKEGGYVEIHGSAEGELRVRAGEQVQAAFRWGDVLEKTEVEKGSVRVSLVSPGGKQWVHVRVEDEQTGRPVGCRVHFRSSHGAYFAPHGHQADVNTAWFEDMGGDCKVRGTPYAYIDGTCQIELPIGPVFVEVVRGFEYTPLRKRVEIKPGQRDLSLKIKRALDMKGRQFYSGDTHVHFLSSQSAHLEAAGEDLNVVNLLASQWGRLFTSWEEFTGGLAPTSSNDHKIWVSQENRQHVLGHISLLGLKEMVAPMCTGGPQEDWVGGEIQALMADWAEACRKQGGLVIMPHMPLPDFENAANIVLGQADAAEMCWIWKGEEIGQGERGYYRWLNTGKLPIVGGTDKMSNGRVLGGSRTYALLADGEEFTFENWCQAVKRGTTFASTGAMIDLHAEGARMGQEIHLPGNGGTVEVTATAESVWPLTAVELIVNGRRVARQDADGDRRMVTVKFDLKAEKSCWVAARCWGEHFTDAGPVMAHSSPVYIDVGGRCAFEPTDGEYLLTHMEGGVSWAEQIGVFRDEAVR
ncbi:MAG: CehA/McbA family metallohydrolase, partial [bacterium]|nr:CehA/McbA family metallohydrolase [bacterium]